MAQTNTNIIDIQRLDEITAPFVLDLHVGFKVDRLIMKMRRIYVVVRPSYCKSGASSFAARFITSNLNLETARGCILTK
jgi:hypothetical protein